MDSLDKKSRQENSHDSTAFMGWGCIGGSIIGAIIGAFAGHWVFWAIAVGTVGVVIGGLIDRGRR